MNLLSRAQKYFNADELTDSKKNVDLELQK